MVATGRKPNVKNIGLEDAGVEFTPKDGVLVDDYLRTTNKASALPKKITPRYVEHCSFNSL